MKMIIGGAFQGKKQFTVEMTGIDLNQAADGMNCEEEAVFGTPVILHFHEYVKRQMAKGNDCSTLAEELIRRNPSVVIVTNEIGYGVVPMDQFDRNYRENTGRICCKLAAFSDEVWRVCCGIGTCLKKTDA